MNSITHYKPRAWARARACLAALALSSAVFAPMLASAQTLVPTIVGGSDNGTTRRTLLTDSAGRLIILGSGSGGIVYGPDISVVPTQAPITIGCQNAVGAVAANQIVRTSCDAGGRFNVNAIQSGTWNIGTITTLPSLATGGNVIGGVTQSGTWNIGTITTLPAIAGATTAADGSALTLTLKDYALQGLYNGTTFDMFRAVNGASAGTGIGVAATAQVPTSSANNGVVPVVSASVESGHVLKASAGNLYRVTVTTGATAGFLMVFNSTTVPVDGAVTPILCRQVPAGASVEVDHSTIPDVYATGISAAFSTTGCFTKTASATAMIEGVVK